MLDINRLRALHAVAVHGSISGAATALGFTPSAVSQQITKLERETRTALLDRHARHVTLTPAAEALAETARQVVALLEQAETGLEAQRRTPCGTLRLAAFPTACRSLVPGMLADLTRRYEELDCRLVEADPSHALGLVTEGEVDMAIVHDWHNVTLVVPSALATYEVGEDVGDVLLHEDHPMADRRGLTLDDLLDQRWISHSPGAMCHSWLERTFTDRGLRPDIAYYADEFQSQIALVAAGLGAAVVPRLGRGPLPPDVRAIPLDPGPHRKIYAVWRRQTGSRPSIRAALGALRMPEEGG
ncbi:LysR family transcriptional regulator, partial [Streptomyces sp. UNOC14_S4]|uniref:LysR family transcriptional regulator n=1 Tax=Streptomyces sp. UNOC14_S4 TaxID=2872340 RepID=UPI001E48A1CC